MGRENTIKWLESIDQEEAEKESEHVPESPKELNGNKEDHQFAWEDIDARHRSWKESAIYFWQSQKGRELSMGSSIIYALSLAVVAVAVVLSDALTDGADEPVDIDTVNEFFTAMYTMSIIGMVTLIILGLFRKLTIDKGQKGHRNSFTTAGMIVLASGSLIYKGLVLAMNAMRPGCSPPLENVRYIFASTFIIIQVGFLLKHCGTRINISLPVALISRVLLMQVIATNLCIWFDTIVYETVHEIDDLEEEEMGRPNRTRCSGEKDDIDNLTGPYLFPLLIEFCVVASTMVLGVWEKSGMGLKVNEKIIKAKRDRTVAFTGVPQDEDEEDDTETHMEGMTTTGSTHGDHNAIYQNSNAGFLFGWLVLLASIILVLIGIYNGYSKSGNVEIMLVLPYASNVAFTLAVIVAIVIAFRQMSVLTLKDGEIKKERHKGGHSHSLHVGRKVNIGRRLDKNLIIVTFYALLAYKVMSMIAGYEKGDWLLFCDGLVCIAMALLQSIFIAWYAFEKRTTKEIHRATKPGRQALEFLRCCNLALWLVNTFLLKNSEAKGHLNDVFGHQAWVIISNIVQPLTILYYFHCTMCLAEIIHLCYTTKYIGIVRKSKQQSESPYSSAADLTAKLQS